MRWYVIQVKTGGETEIAGKLTGLGIRALAPTENRPIHTDGAWCTKNYVLFPGYVFLQMDYNAENYYRLKEIPGVVKLLAGTLSYLEAEWILLLAGRKGEPLEPTLVRESGGRLEVQEGILEQFKSRIVKMDKRNRRAVIELSVCGETKQVQLGIRLPEETDTGSGQAADG